MPAKKWSDKLKEAEKAPSFKELDEGSYSFVINDAGKVGEYNGVEQISINPAVEAGPRTGSRLFHNFNFPDDNPQVLRIVFEQFQALGLGEDFFQSEPSMEQVSQALKGRRFTADVVHSKSKDGQKTYVNLRNFKPSVSPSAMPAGPGGPGLAAPSGPGAPQYAAPAPQMAQAPAPQTTATVNNPDTPWGGQPQAAAQAPAGGPWDNVAPQQYQQQQAPAQQAPVVQQQQQQPQTWQAPPVPPLS